MRAHVHHLNLLVLSAGLLLVLLAESGTTATVKAPQAEPDVDVQQLTLADVNQATEQQEMPAVRLARQFYGGRRGFGGGGFGRGGFGRGREDSAAAAATAGSGDQVLEVASVDSTRHHRRPSSAAPSTAKCYSFNVHM